LTGTAANCRPPTANCSCPVSRLSRLSRCSRLSRRGWDKTELLENKGVSGITSTKCARWSYKLPLLFSTVRPCAAARTAITRNLFHLSNITNRQSANSAKDDITMCDRLQFVVYIKHRERISVVATAHQCCHQRASRVIFVLSGTDLTYFGQK